MRARRLASCAAGRCRPRLCSGSATCSQFPTACSAKMPNSSSRSMEISPRLHDPTNTLSTCDSLMAGQFSFGFWCWWGLANLARCGRVCVNSSSSPERPCARFRVLRVMHASDGPASSGTHDAPHAMSFKRGYALARSCPGIRVHSLTSPSPKGVEACCNAALLFVTPPLA